MRIAEWLGTKAAVVVDQTMMGALHAVVGAERASHSFLASFKTELEARRASRLVAQHVAEHPVVLVPARGIE